MNTITFDKKYTKLPAGIKTAVLVACEPVRGENQTELFLKYDTIFKISSSESWFESEVQGDYLCLVLKSDSGAIFTTLRKDNFENRAKYMCQLCGSDEWSPLYNKQFQIIIKEG